MSAQQDRIASYWNGWDAALVAAAKSVMALPDSPMFYAGSGKPPVSHPGVIHVAEARDAVLAHIHVPVGHKADGSTASAVPKDAAPGDAARPAAPPTAQSPQGVAGTPTHLGGAR